MRWTGAPQTGHGLPIAAVDGHAFAERGDLLGKRPRRLPRAAARSTPRACAAWPRSSRAISSSVRLRVSFTGDSCAACRISSEYALPMPLKRCGSVSARLSVWFSRVSRSANAGSVGVEHFEPAGIERGEARRSRARGASTPALRALLGEDQRAGREVERRQADLARDGRAPLPPAQPSGDHQVQDEEQVCRRARRRSVCPSAAARRPASLDRGDGRLDRAHQERIPEPQPLERLIQHPRGQRFEIERDVG